MPLPASPLNKFGYSIEFGATGNFDGLRVDFPAITAHLYYLEGQASDRGVKIRRVILDLEFERQLPWVRHDEHYHVDFLPG